MSRFTEDALSRYLDRNPDMRRALLHDPAQAAQLEMMRRMLDTADRAMSDEGVPSDARDRVVNRIIWGDPEGNVDFYEQARAALKWNGATG